ncbi:MAG: hypothetical protein AAFR61_31405 [Bacteroidota bacterium]
MKRLTFPLIMLALVFLPACSLLNPGEGPNGNNNLDDLEGQWIRIASNNPASDGMIIEMSGNSGTIIDKAGSGFSVGDIKWKDIEAVDGENYLHSELGSDYNYYAGSIELRGDDTLRVSVASSGAGNVQKWVREGTYTPGQNTQKLECSITTPTVLTNGPAEVDYLIDCVLDITEAVTIEPGVVIQISENGGIGVYDAGTLKAQGTEAEPIIIQGTSPQKGWWRGIHMETSSSNNVLEHVRIEDAGSNYVYCCNEKAALFLKGARLTVNNLTIKNGKSNGIVARKGTEFDTYQEVKIQGQDDYPLYFYPEVAGYLDGTASDYSGNGKDFVYLTQGDITETTTWPRNNVPYRMDGEVLDITAPFKLEAGVEIVVESDGGIGVYDEGSFNVEGTAAAPVVIRGVDDVRGYWRGIQIESNKLANSMNYMEVSNAGSNYVYCCNEIGSMYLKDGRASIKNSTFRKGAAYGIIAKDKFSFADFESNTITDHAREPMLIAVERAGELDGVASSFSGNDRDFIEIFEGQVTQEITMPANNVPYKITTNRVIDVKEKFNILPGVVIAFAENAGLGVYDDGVLNADGTASEKIIFRGTDASAGYWRGIHTETNSNSNLLRHVELRHAASNYVYCCNSKAALFVKDGKMKVESSYIADNDGCGIFVRAGATLTESGNTFANNTDGHICN